MSDVVIKKQTIVINGQPIVIYCYELFVELLASWKKQGMSREEIEELLLS